jgi:MFS family permease
MNDQSPQTNPSESARLPRNVKLLGFVSLLNDVASEMIFPLLPQFLLNVLHGSTAWLGTIEGAADSLGSLMKLWSGGRSDRGGRRKGLVVFGYALANLIRPLVGLIWLPWQLFAVRITDRIGKGVRTSPRDALIADSTAAEIRGRAFGFHRGMDHLGAAIGPLLAAAFLWFWREADPGVFETWVRRLFLFTAVPGVLVVLLLWLGLREPARTSVTQARPTLTLKPFDRRFRIYLAALVVFTLANSSDAFLLLRAGELGVAVWMLPILWSVFHVAKSAGNIFCGRLVDRFGPRPMILFGWGYYAVVYLAFALASTEWHIWALFLAYAVFYSITEPAEKTLVANLVGPENRGLAYGWFNCAVGIATLPASLLFGVLYQEAGPFVAFGSGAGLALVAAALLARMPRQ